MVTISVVVPAAGHGVRAGRDANKIFVSLAGQPLLLRTLHALTSASYGAANVQLREVVVAARLDEFELIRPLFTELPANVNYQLAEGGATRQDSVYNAVRQCGADFILVHDAARPCVTEDIVLRTVRAAVEAGAAIAALPASDTVKRTVASDSPLIAETLDRRTIWLAQTPQIFRRTVLLEALAAARRDDFQGTDCASLVERAGHPVALVEGSVDNIKVTYPADFERAEAGCR